MSLTFCVNSHSFVMAVSSQLCSVRLNNGRPSGFLRREKLHPIDILILKAIRVIEGQITAGKIYNLNVSKVVSLIIHHVAS